MEFIILFCMLLFIDTDNLKVNYVGFFYRKAERILKSANFSSASEPLRNLF
jgi:hypothetical protein